MPVGSRRRAEVVRRVLAWYATHARDLPWRRPEATPWPILVSEVMLQQTPVARVLGPWQEWTHRWPNPASLAEAPAGEAIRAWGRLGYPRRALRLHAAAGVLVERHGGAVPDDYAQLRRLPGVGAYTAAAVASFAFGQRHVVLDTNVRRLLARVEAGVADPGPTLAAAETMTAEHYLPRSPAAAARWGVAAMEVGALVCRARSPRCAECPIASLCRWRTIGGPMPDQRPRRAQTYGGTDRQCRGAILGVLRASHRPIGCAALVSAWPDEAQRERALATLLVDRLIVSVGADRVALPGC